MEKIKDLEHKLSQGYVPGWIKYNKKCDLYFMPVAYWILNYRTYDPGYDPKKWEFIFRDNILIVGDNDIDNYLKAIEIDKIDLLASIEEILDDFCIFIDFDNKLFVSYFPEIEIEIHLPHHGWTGKYDDPRGYLPADCRVK